MNKYYVSNITNFLKKYKELHPEVKNLQIEGRSIFWNKTVDCELEKQFKSARVFRKSYVYQDN